MAINFEQIPSDIIVPSNPPEKTRTVQEELNARQSLLKERAIKCKDIRPFFEKMKKDPLRYAYKYFCVCPRYNPQYLCRHTGNIIIDRDVLTQDEHIVYLATPKPNLAAPRKNPRYILKKSILPNCTARVNRLAAPDKKHVVDTLNNYYNLMPKWRRKLLKMQWLQKPPIEYTNIPKALEWLYEERRLKRVAKRKERLCYKKLTKKIVRKQRAQIKKIICILFEEMRDFLLNDQFVMDESSTLVSVILEALKDFADKDFFITSNLREYQKILAFNLAVWINKFISNLNIHVADQATHYPQMPQVQPERPTQELSTFIPVSDYISCSSESEEATEDDKEYYSFKEPTTADIVENAEPTDKSQNAQPTDKSQNAQPTDK